MTMQKLRSYTLPRPQSLYIYPFKYIESSVINFNKITIPASRAIKKGQSCGYAGTTREEALPHACEDSACEISEEGLMWN